MLDVITDAVIVLNTPNKISMYIIQFDNKYYYYYYRSYACYASLDSTEVMDRIYSSFTASLSDRAAVNHCVTEEISVLLGRELVYLNCNVHPLDGLATATRKDLLVRCCKLNSISLGLKIHG